VIDSELSVLSRAHQLFAGSAPRYSLDAGFELRHPALEADGNDVGTQGGYRAAAEQAAHRLATAARTDAVAAGAIAQAHRDRAEARELTKAVLDQARADSPLSPATPMAQREAMRRRVARLRAQHQHVLTARTRARQHATALRSLQYLRGHHAGLRSASSSLGAAAAVRAALSRLGRPYVWGATGPDQFDCSGLVQWSYARAGIHLGRTTYQQINDGIPVPRSQVRPGDLVFPHAGHVQMAIGNNLVVEAPYSGASVRISPLGNHVTIRRPL
jgi:peptidoglycan DL-endopeptidase CwlO